MSFDLSLPWVLPWDLSAAERLHTKMVDLRWKEWPGDLLPSSSNDDDASADDSDLEADEAWRQLQEQRQRRLIKRKPTADASVLRTKSVLDPTAKIFVPKNTKRE